MLHKDKQPADTPSTKPEKKVVLKDTEGTYRTIYLSEIIDFMISSMESYRYVFDDSQVEELRPYATHFIVEKK